MKFDLLDECFNGTVEDVRSLLAKNKYSIKYLSQALAMCASTLLPLQEWVHGYILLNRPARSASVVSTLIHLLVEKGATFHIPHYNGTPALHYICAVQHVELFTFALQEGANLHAVDWCGLTVAHYAIQYLPRLSFFSIVRARELSGCKIIQSDPRSFLKLLKHQGVNFFREDNGGTYPYDLAPRWLQTVLLPE
jgi:ankyrin repeat protein